MSAGSREVCKIDQVFWAIDSLRLVSASKREVVFCSEQGKRFQTDIFSKLDVVDIIISLIVSFYFLLSIILEML